MESPFAVVRLYNGQVHLSAGYLSVGSGGGKIYTFYPFLAQNLLYLVEFLCLKHYIEAGVGGLYFVRPVAYTAVQ